MMAKKPESDKRGRGNPDLREIAKQFLAIINKERRPQQERNLAGYLFVEAIRNGAFGRRKHAELRERIDKRVVAGNHAAAFESAVDWLRQNETGWPALKAWEDQGAHSLIKNGCRLIGEALVLEADVPEIERKIPPPEIGAPQRQDTCRKMEKRGSGIARFRSMGAMRRDSGGRGDAVEHGGKNTLSAGATRDRAEGGESGGKKLRRTKAEKYTIDCRDYRNQKDKIEGFSGEQFAIDRGYDHYRDFDNKAMGWVRKNSARYSEILQNLNNNQGGSIHGS